MTIIEAFESTSKSRRKGPKLFDLTWGRERISMLAAEAVEEAGGGGPEAWKLLSAWLRAEPQLMLVVAEDALHERVLREVQTYVRKERKAIKQEVLTEPVMGAVVSPELRAELAGVAVKFLSRITLPIPGNPMLCTATCADAYTAIEYKHKQMSPALIDVRWWRLILDGRRDTDSKLLTKRHTEAKLRDLRMQAIEEIKRSHES